MKVLLFTDSLGAGGAQRQLIGLAKMLNERGYCVKVCTYHSLDFYKSFLDANDVPNELIPNAHNVLKRIIAVYKYFRKEDPDWVIAYQETPSLIACVCRLLGLSFKLLVSERNTTQRVGWNERLRFQLYRYANYIVPNSFSQEKFLLNNYSWMKCKLHTIVNFVDLHDFSFSAKLRSKKTKILVAATIWPSKNTIGLINALNILKNKNLDFIVEWYGIVEGHEKYVQQCNDLIDEFGLHKYIELLEKTKTIHEKYKECDFFCLPSFYEGTPNVICEAMACGCPIICSDVCDNAIYVAKNENGFLFDPQNPYDIAKTIECAISISDDDFISMCTNSRAKAEKLLSEDVFILKYINLLNNPYA